MLAVGDFKGQQKAAMALSTLGNRKYTLWAISCIYMSLKFSNVTDVEKTLFPKLALGLLKKTEPVKSPQEAYLKCLIYEINNLPNDIIHYLQTEEVRNWDSLDLNIILFETLIKIQDWQGLKNQCIRILKNLSRDDFNHWKGLISACINLKDVEFLYKFISDYKVGQNSKLALVHLSFELGNNTDYTNIVPSLNEATEKYFEYMGDKRSVFNDLRAYMLSPLFDRTKWLKFLDQIEIKNSQQNLPVNVEKFRFLFRPESYNVDSLIQHQVHLYNESKHFLKKKDDKDYHSGDDYLLIAAYAILETSIDFQSLTKAAVLLELACENDKHQFYVRLWLVVIYQLLGAFKKSFHHYSVLRVQNLQVDSMSHFIITRSMSFFPNDSVLVKAINTYQTFNDEVVNGLLKVYENDVYTQLESFFQLRKVVDNSITKSILGVQLSQLSHYPHKTFDLSFLNYTDTAKLEDNRDFDIMWDIPRPNTHRLSHIIMPGPRVGPNWVKIHETKNEIIKSLIKTDRLSETSLLLKDLLNDRNTLIELTEAEIWSCQVILSLAESALNKLDHSGYEKIYFTLSSLKLDLQLGWKLVHTLFQASEISLIINEYVVNLHRHRNQIKYDNHQAENLKNNLLEQFVPLIKETALKIKNSRNEKSQADIAFLNDWLKDNRIDMNGALIESVVDSIYASLDESLTLIRTTKF